MTEFTERLTLDGISLISLEHLHRYAYAREYSQDKIVLDIACGEGYGSDIISKVAKKVVGVDISQDAISKAKTLYSHSNNLEFIVSTALNLPFEDKTFDLVVSFETIEHFNEHEDFLSEIVRVIKNDGVLIMSTPDKFYYSELTNHKNPFHIKELYESEFKQLIAKYFRNCRFAKQRCEFASILIPENEEVKYVAGLIMKDNSIRNCKDFGPIYWIVTATNDDSKDFKQLNFLIDNNFIKDKNDHIENLHVELENVNTRYNKSTSYILGKNILAPFHFFKRMLKYLSKDIIHNSKM